MPFYTVDTLPFLLFSSHTPKIPPYFRFHSWEENHHSLVAVFIYHTFLSVVVDKHKTVNCSVATVSHRHGA